MVSFPGNMADMAQVMAQQWLPKHRTTDPTMGANVWDLEKLANGGVHCPVNTVPSMYGRALGHVWHSHVCSLTNIVEP